MASSPPEARPDSALGVRLVLSLWEAMRARGAMLTPQQLTAGLGLARVAGDDLDRLGGMLAGVFAKDVAEMAMFRQLLRDACAQAAPTKPDGAVGEPFSPRRRARIEATVWIAGAQVLAATAGVALVHFLPQPPPEVTTGGTTTIPTGAAPAPQSLGLRATQQIVETRVPQPPPWWRATEYAVLALPLALVLALLAWRWARTPAWVRLSVDEQEQLLENGLRDPGAENLFTGPAVRRLARGLRRPRPSPRGEIDVPRTIRATVAAAGRLMLVQAAPTRARPLHLAVERESQEDHLVQLFARAGRRLADLGAVVRVFHYRRDVRTLFDEDGKRLSAAEAATGDEDPLLALIGEGEGLDGGGAAQDAARWTAMQAWSSRHLLSTRRALAWDQREPRLVGKGVSVSPASEAGLLALAFQLDRERPGLSSPDLRPSPSVPPPP